MDERDRVEQRLATVLRLRRPLGFVCGGVLAALYVYWRLTAHHVIAVYTWVIPFAFGVAIAHFPFAVIIDRLENRRRELEGLADVPLPRAEVVRRPEGGAVADNAVAPSVAPSPPPAPVAPVEQTPLSEQPRFLK